VHARSKATDCPKEIFSLSRARVYHELHQRKENSLDKYTAIELLDLSDISSLKGDERETRMALSKSQAGDDRLTRHCLAEYNADFFV
jgi:hypothetical protein